MIQPREKFTINPQTWPRASPAGEIEISFWAGTRRFACRSNSGTVSHAGHSEHQAAQVLPGPVHLPDSPTITWATSGTGLRVIRGSARWQRFRFPARFRLQFRELPIRSSPAYRDRMDIKFYRNGFPGLRLTREQTRRLVDERSGAGLSCHVHAVRRSLPSIGSSRTASTFSRLRAAFLHGLAASRKDRRDQSADHRIDGWRMRRKWTMWSSCAIAREFALMAASQYPTPRSALQLNQIDVRNTAIAACRSDIRRMKIRTRRCLSRHGDRQGRDPVRKNISAFRPPNGPLNTIQPIRRRRAPGWKPRATLSRSGAAAERIGPTPDELAALRDARHISSKRPHRRASASATDDVFFAIPTTPGQITANDWSENTHFTATEVAGRCAGHELPGSKSEIRAKVLSIVGPRQQLLAEARASFPAKTELEISHHSASTSSTNSA